MKKPAYSWSALETYFGGPTHGGCPRAYRLIRIDKIPRADSEPLLIGQNCHKLAADYLTRLVKTGQTTDWEFAAGLLTPSTHPDVAEIFRRFYENFILPPIENPGIEKQLAFNRAWEPVEWFAKDAFFRMILDFTFTQGGLACIIDHKTNRAVIEIDPQNIPLQLKIYAWGALRAIFPKAQEVLLRLNFLRYGVDREILLTPDSLATVPQELEEKISFIEADSKHAPTPGSFCGWCGVTAHCPTMAQALVPVEIMAPATRADAEKAAKLLLAIEAMDKTLKERLKDWVRENGPVVVGDMCYGPVPTQTYNLDAQVVVGYLLEAGLEKEQVWSFLGTTKTALERGLSKLRRKDLLPPLLEMSECKTTERVQFSKIK